MKLADFGISKTLVNRSKATTHNWNPCFQPPEMIKKNKSYSFPVDIWSLGVILYELCTLEHPFGLDSAKSSYEVYQVVNKIIEGNYKEIPDFYSNEMK